MPEITRRVVWENAKLVSGAPIEDDCCVAVAVLLTSAMIGPNTRKCARFLGLPETRIRWMAQNLRKSGVWKGRYIHAGEDWFGENGGIALNMDAAVALGLLERAKRQPKVQKTGSRLARVKAKN